MDREDSLTRNVRYAAKVVGDRKAQLTDLLGRKAETTTDDIETRAAFDKLTADVARSSRTLAQKDVELRSSEVHLADAASRLADLQIAYRQVFASRLSLAGAARFHPTVEETLRSGTCTVCGQTGAAAHVQARLDASECPLCEAALSPGEADGELMDTLRQIDVDLHKERRGVEEAGARRERLKREHAAAVDGDAQAKAALADFEADHAGAEGLPDPANQAMVAQEIAKLETERAALIRRSDEHRAKRDAIRDELRELETGLQTRYERASTTFVPRFRQLAEEFIGLPIDIELENQRGVATAGFALRMRMDGKLRLTPDRLSESQRFFIDIALRMALAEFMSASGSPMLIDTPEGSLDITYEARAGNMFDIFARDGNSIVMTANLRSSKLIERLAERCGPDGMQIVKMTRWTDLSDVQRAEENLFDEAYTAIENALAR